VGILSWVYPVGGLAGDGQQRRPVARDLVVDAAAIGVSKRQVSLPFRRPEVRQIRVFVGSTMGCDRVFHGHEQRLPSFAREHPVV
jgi:hypothetical protein